MSNTEMIMLLLYLPVFVIGMRIQAALERGRGDQHEHAFDSWVLKPNMTIKYPGNRNHLDYKTDMQERTCIGCGYMERRIVSPT